MVGKQTLTKAQSRLNRDYGGDFDFRLTAGRPKGVQVEVHDNLPTIVQESGKPRVFAIFTVPLSKKPGIEEVVRRVQGGFQRYLSIAPRESMG